MPITLENRVRQMQVFNLPHHAYCKDGCACSDTSMLVLAVNPRNGEPGRMLVERMTPASLTLLAGERRSGLPTALLDVPEVKAAIARGSVRIVEQIPDMTETSSQPAAPKKKEK